MRPIRTTEDNAFAHDTMVRRLPANIRNIITTHTEYSPAINARLEELAAGIAGNEAIPPLPLPAPDAEYWREAYARRAGERWHDTDWFFGETYAFRLIIETVRYLETLIDPFAPMKERELASGAPFLPIERFFGADGPGAELLAAVEETGDPGTVANPRAILEDAIHLCIWGNRADISFTAGGDLDHSAGEKEQLLVDDAGPAAEILRQTGKPIHIVMDNSGAELAGDLVLALVATSVSGAPVVLHPKAYPTYVSDTTVPDVHTWLRRAAQHDEPVVQRFASAVTRAFSAGDISLAPDHFWCETEFLTDMPERLKELFSDAGIVVVKGDFNYRRAARDTIWDPGTTLTEAMGLTAPQPPWLLLRTMKSDSLAGVDPALTTRLDRDDPGWRTAGRRGVIQLVV